MVAQPAQLRDARHRVIYEGDSERLLAVWYFGLRASEEVARAERYERPLTLMVITLDSFDGGSLERWLAEKLRATDLVCRSKPGNYFVMLPETDEAKAASVSERLLADFPGATLSSVSVPPQLDRFDALIYRLDER
jgi:GGDEF domain-containing protein